LGHPDCQIARIRAITTQAEIRMSAVFGWVLTRKLRDGNTNSARPKKDVLVAALTRDDRCFEIISNHHLHPITVRRPFLQG